MTKTELDILRGHVRKELITDNSRFLDRQNNQFQEGWYAAVRDMEICLDNLREDSPDLEEGKIKELQDYIQSSRRNLMSRAYGYDVLDVGMLDGFLGCLARIEGWIDENVFNHD